MQADFESFVKDQNKELASAGSNPNKQAAVPQVKENSASLEFNEPIQSRWNLVARRGAEAKHLLTENKKTGSNILKVDVLKLGERPWDMILLSKDQIMLQKGDEITFKFFARGEDLKFNLQAEDKSKNLTRKIKGSAKKPEVISFRIEEAGLYNVKFQFGTRGEHTIGRIVYEIK